MIVSPCQIVFSPPGEDGYPLRTDAKARWLELGTQLMRCIDQKISCAPHNFTTVSAEPQRQGGRGNLNEIAEKALGRRHGSDPRRRGRRRRFHRQMAPYRGESCAGENL